MLVENEDLLFASNKALSSVRLGLRSDNAEMI